MIRVTSRALMAATLAGAAVASAGQAFADSTLDGKYSVVGGSDQFFVTATSNCATEGCTANLVSNRGWTSTAVLSNGTWSYSVRKPDGVICGDGNFADIVIRYAINANTLTGTVTADSNGECPGGQVS